MIETSAVKLEYAVGEPFTSTSLTVTAVAAGLKPHVSFLL